MKNSFDPDFSLPQPDSHGGRGKVILLAIACVLILACACWWLTRNEDEKKIIRESAADAINEKLDKTPLAGMGDILRESPPPLPPQLLNPGTEPGTLSGRTVAATVGSPVDTSPGQHPATAPQLNLASSSPLPPTPVEPDFSSTPLPPVTEDSKIKPTWLQELAQWLAARYKPDAQGGNLSVSIQNLNTHLGGKLAAEAGGRSAMLRYALQPSMISGLYNLYIGRFMEDLNMAARNRGFNEREIRQFHKALAGRVAVIAAAMNGVIQLPNLKERLEEIDQKSQAAVDLNAQMASVTFELDELAAANAPAQQLNAMRMRLNGITARYRRAMEEHQQAQRTLADQIRKNAGQSLDDEGLLFMAAWVQRRMNQERDAEEALKSCVEVLRSLARRCSADNSGSQG